VKKPGQTPFFRSSNSVQDSWCLIKIGAKTPFLTRPTSIQANGAQMTAQGCLFNLFSESDQGTPFPQTAGHYSDETCPVNTLFTLFFAAPDSAGINAGQMPKIALFHGKKGLFEIHRWQALQRSRLAESQAHTRSERFFARFGTPKMACQRALIQYKTAKFGIPC